MLGDFTHTHLVSKLMAYWLMRGVLQTPPTIGTQRTWGSCVGVVVVIGAWLRVDRHGSCAWRGVGGISISWCGAMFVMGGTDPGMLFCVLCICVHFVKRSVHLVVGLKAVIMSSVSVMHCITGGCGSVSAATLYSTLCSTVGMYGDHWRSPGGNIQS